MDRRSFVKESFAATIAFSALRKTAFFDGWTSDVVPYDLVAVKGGEPGAMFDSGIAVLGGMKAFVRKGDKVVIKPNIGWDVTPERGADTNPKLIAKIVGHCLDAGAKEVSVVDHPCDEWHRCYTNSGIESAAKDVGAKVIPGASESYYQTVNIPEGKTLKSVKEHEVILDSDVFINVPILKCHSGTRLTAAMKNLMGNVWDRESWHRTGVEQCIADFATYRKPDLNILDAYYVMKQNGPRGVSADDVVLMKAQIISADIVATDVAGAKLFGIDPGTVEHIKIASEMKIGKSNLEQLSIKRISL